MQNINLKQKGICRICGCTATTACYNPKYGTCWWIDETETLCSHCSIEEIKNDKATDKYREELI
ncbi:MAG: hypothetical protein SPH83_11960 [Treponema sp.]|nr:hypothetical protein [Spirochaetales bacterium]MDY6191186.1 hypothetical protein [Treponema sp.]